MKTMIKWRRTAVLAVALLTVLQLSLPVLAAQGGGIDPSEPVSLTIDLKSANKRAALSIYRVGEWDGTQGAYVVSGVFAQADVAFGEMTADEVKQAADKLIQFAKEQQISPLATQETAGGIASFADLESGMYLICQEGSRGNVTITPFLTTLPVMDEESHSWIYAVTSQPKNITSTTSPGGGDRDDPDPTTAPETSPSETTAPETSTEESSPTESTEETVPPTSINPSEPPTPDESYPSRDELPPEIIFENLIPLGGGYYLDPGTNNIILIMDESVPLGTLPSAGDEARGSIPAAMALLVSSCSVFALIVWRRKRQQ